VWRIEIGRNAWCDYYVSSKPQTQPSAKGSGRAVHALFSMREQ
jgi:hypothetical protein